MKKYMVFFLVNFLLANNPLKSQVLYETFRSVKLDQTRALKIQLPRNYKKEEKKIYPLILVLDGDYLFEPVVGNTDYFSYWGDIPESIVVGINQRKTRSQDCQYDPSTHFPSKKATEFFDFISEELFPYLKSTYRIAELKIIVGHDFTGNFINYFLLKDNPIFHGYINLSPEYAPSMVERVETVLQGQSSDIWYYLATATNDAANLKKKLVIADSLFTKIENPNVNYSFDNFAESSHYTLVGRAIPRALEAFFEMYRPISKKNYKEVILELEGSKYDHLVDIYQKTEKLYGIKRKIRINDFIAISTAIEKKQEWEDLEKLGKLAIKEHPKTMLGYYYLGMYHEQIGEPKKALRAYENGFQLEETAFLTRDYMLEKVTKIKEDFGW